jgi:ParB-like chromosome segregation protein Spo0J
MMEIVKKELSNLHHPDRNVRMHSTKQLSEFRRSIEMFGQIRPIVADESGMILAGNGLYDALLSMGREDADCYVVCNLSEKEKKKLMLADNRVFSLGVDNIEAFDAIIAELGNDLDVPGYDPELLQSLVAEVGDVDDIIGGYGTISDADKVTMAKAASRYEEEEKAFTEGAEEVKPLPPQESQFQAPQVAPIAETVVTSPASETPIATPHELLQRKFVVCPKCGEKIWM